MIRVSRLPLACSLCCWGGTGLAADGAGPGMIAPHDVRAAAVSPDGRHLADLEADEPTDETVQPIRRLVIRDLARADASRRTIAWFARWLHD